MKELRQWLQSPWTWFFITFILILVLLSLPTPQGLSSEGQKALVLLVAVVVLFIAEPISLPGIILFIAIYQVFMGLGTPNEVARSFMHDAVFFIMGALMIGVALTRQGIGKRLILFLIDQVGNSTRKISFAIVTTCALLAGFMADHVVAAVMTPMVLSLIKTTREGGQECVANLSKLLLFSVAYGSSIGGLYAPSGGGRNIIMMGLLDQMYGLKINYGEWIILALPVTLLLIPVTVAILSLVFRPETLDLSRAMVGLREELEERELTGEAWVTLFILALTVFLWITIGSSVGLGAIALLGATLCLMFGVVDWEDYHTDVNWGVILIYMGALSLGNLLARTGAAGWIAHSALTFLREGLGLDGLLPIAAMSSLLTTAMTNLMSAAGSTSVVGPITLKLSELSSFDPVTIGLLTAISSAFGYLLLLATPPNAIIYSSGYIRSVDFLKAGIGMTVTSLLILFSVVLVWWPIFNFI
ncbi:MAG: SLC13 family permease [Candidatus Bipolaricaulota bacterium]